MNTSNNGQRAQGVERTHPCAREKVPIIPLRYAVAPKSTNANAYAYTHANLDKNRPVKLEKSQYVLRTVRPGYIYLFDGAETHLWEAQGNGTFVKLKYPDLEQSTRPGNTGQSTACIWAWKDRGIVDIGFVPDMLTAKMVTKINDTSFRATFMHSLNIAELIDGGEQPSTQKHTLPLWEVPGNVEEYTPSLRKL